MDAANFRAQLRENLLRQKDQVLLRIAVSPNFETPVELKGRDLVEGGCQMAARCAAAPKDGVILLLLPHSPELFLLHLGLILEGYVPSILAWPTSRIDPVKYQRNLVHQLSHLPADQVITLPGLADNLKQQLPYGSTACAVPSALHYQSLFSAALEPSLSPNRAQAAGRAEPQPGTIFLQFSGGTTGVQKAVLVTSSMLASQLEMLRQCLELETSDSIVSWLPLYHDMGLIACLWFPLWHGLPSLHIGASDWVVNPELLLRYADRYRGTLCWLPNFAFAYLAEQRPRMRGSYDLGSMRAWINCSEPVRLHSMLRFASAFAACGVREGALQASYAMAESTFAVTQTRLREPLPRLPRARVRSSAKSYTDLAWSVLDDVFVSSGRPLPGTEVRIVDGNGALCQPGEAGEIQIRTPSLFGGYWGSDGFVKNSLAPDGFHSTGDFGFLVDQELFVIGRTKDIVIIGGQNVFPEDIESVVNSLADVYPGRVVAFGIEDEQYGTETLAVVAELKGDYEEAAARRLEVEIRKLVLATIAIAPRFVAVVPQRWIVKSTAGKISRRDTRERFIREKLAGPWIQEKANA